MKYSVIWQRSAEDQLAEIWLAADDRELITRTASAIDEHLEKSGPSAGESRPDGKRILIMAPLGVKAANWMKHGLQSRATYDFPSDFLERPRMGRER